MPAKRNVRDPAGGTSRWDAIATEYPDNAGFRSRLDKLLESAIAEQGREQQGFMEVLQASRDALTAVRTELDGMRGVVEHVARQDAMESLQHRVELLEGEQASLKKALTVKLDGIARTLEAVEWRTQEGMSALANRVGELQSSFGDGDLTATTVAALKELGENIETRQQEVAEATLKALDPV